MKKIVSAIAIVLSFSLSSFAQNDREQREERMTNRMESMKIAYITDELELSTTEAQSFWPLFNEYSSKMKSLKESKKTDKQPMEMSEAEAEKYLQDLISYKEEELSIQREYVEKMKSVIPSQKVAELFILESRFRDKMVKRIKERMSNREKMKRKNRKENRRFKERQN